MFGNYPPSSDLTGVLTLLELPRIHLRFRPIILTITGRVVDLDPSFIVAPRRLGCSKSRRHIRRSAWRRGWSFKQGADVSYFFCTDSGEVGVEKGRSGRLNKRKRMGKGRDSLAIARETRKAVKEE